MVSRGRTDDMGYKGNPGPGMGPDYLWSCNNVRTNGREQSPGYYINALNYRGSQVKYLAAPYLFYFFSSFFENNQKVKKLTKSAKNMQKP